MTRPSWDEYFLAQCNLIATRSTCDRKHVGAIIVKDKRIISTGFNGSLSGLTHCDDPEVFYLCHKCQHKSEIVSKEDSFYIHCPECYEKLSKENIRYGSHDIEDNHCIRTSHAEVNAIAQAAKFGIATEGTTMYCNTQPCWTCFKTVVSAGITELVYKGNYDAQYRDKVYSAAKRLHGFTLRPVEV